MAASLLLAATYGLAYSVAVPEVVGVQKRSNALVRSSVMERGSRPSISWRWSMNTILPSRSNATDGDDGG